MTQTDPGVGTSRKRRTILLASAVAAIIATGGAVTVLATSDDGTDDALAEVRDATRHYDDVDAAVADGYVLLDRCFESDAGGMGYHYIYEARIGDPSLDPLRPEAIVYEPNGDRLDLVAVEYIVPDTNPRPTLFGEEFHHNTELSLWVLHAWIWQENPDGAFADFNPAVGDCPPSAKG